MVKSTQQSEMGDDTMCVPQTLWRGAYLPETSQDCLPPIGGLTHQRENPSVFASARSWALWASKATVPGVGFLGYNIPRDASLIGL